MLLRANHFVLASTLLTQAYGSVLAPVIRPRATVCNGYAEFCDRSYGNITYVGAHDSYAIGAGLLAANQDQNVTQQLNDGIRLLQLQALNQSGTIELCHTSCSLYDGGSLQNYLSIVKTWMDANPNEVLTLLIVNVDNFPPTAFDTVFSDVGLDTMAYKPTSANLTFSEWPTLGVLIASGMRLLVFMDTQANILAVPYIIPEFINIWESAFDVTTTFDCVVNRTQGNSELQMYLINHFLDKLAGGQPVPNIAALPQTNAASGPGSLGAQADECTGEYGRPPTFLLVDFYEYGNGSVFVVAADINGVTYSPATPIATPASTSASFTSTPLNAASFLDHNQRFACIVSVMAVMIGMLIVL